MRDPFSCFLGGGQFRSITVVGPQESLFSGALTGINSLFCFTLIPSNFEICAAHRRSLLLQQAAASSTRRQAHSSTRVFWCRALTESSMSSTTYRTTPKPETHITRQVSRERSCAVARKTENRAPEKRIQAAQPPPPATRRQATQLLGGTCTSMSASCCCCCRSVLLLFVINGTRSLQTRHGLSEGRGVAQFPPSWQAGWYVHVSHVVSFGRVWMGPFYE